MMQVVAVFVDCFPFIRGSHFVDPVWVVVQLVFGRGGEFDCCYYQSDRNDLF